MAKFMLWVYQHGKKKSKYIYKKGQKIEDKRVNEKYSLTGMAQ